MRIRADGSNDRPFQDLAEAGRTSGGAAGGAEADPPVPAAVLELRSALTSILACSEILRDYPDMPDEERARFLEAVIAEGNRLNRMVSRMVERSEFNRSADADPA
jgi:signal transduction histidine kinase